MSRSTLGDATARGGSFGGGAIAEQTAPQPPLQS
jgi:hypothetical protein